MSVRAGSASAAASRPDTCWSRKLRVSSISRSASRPNRKPRYRWNEPALVSRLILIDSGGYRDQDWEAIRSLVTIRDDADVERLYGALFRRVPWIFRLSRTTFRRVFQSPVVTGIMADLQESDLFGPEDIARLQMPVGVIWGEHDGLFAAAVGRQIARAARHGAFYLVPGAGHGLHWEAPRQLVAAMEEAERELPAQRAAPVTSVGDVGEAQGA